MQSLGRGKIYSHQDVKIDSEWSKRDGGRLPLPDPSRELRASNKRTATGGLDAPRVRNVTATNQPSAKST